MVFKALAGFNFAHLVGLNAKSTDKDLRTELNGGAANTSILATAAEEDEAEDEAEEDAETTEGDKDAKKGGKKSGKKNDDEDDDTSEGEDDGDDEEDDEDAEAAEDKAGEKKGGKKGEKAAAPAPAKTDAGSFKRGRKAERRRVGLILSNPAAASNIALATKLACNTGMSSSAAIALLEATPAARGGSLDRRMSDSKIPEVKAGATQELKGEQAIAASWEHANKPFMPSHK
jgi:hypothetical protein